MACGACGPKGPIRIERVHTTAPYVQRTMVISKIGSRKLAPRSVVMQSAGDRYRK